MSTTLHIQICDSEDLYKKTLAIRFEVFVNEQQVPASEEIDEFEDKAQHIIALYNQTPVGTARFRETHFGIKIERVAVLKDFRNLYIGKHIMLFIMGILKNSPKLIYLHAQIQVVPFYNSLNFIEESNIFYEANIPHQKMIYNANKNRFI